MNSFKNYIKQSSIIQKDFSNLPIGDRMAQGRDIGEKFIIEKLNEQGIEIVPVKNHYADTRLKVDGYLGGMKNEPVQIKLRRSSKVGRNDIAYELLRNHNNNQTIIEQLKNKHQQGRDYKGMKVEHYFILNQKETEIYYVPAGRLKDAVIFALDELNLSKMKGKLIRPFKSSQGVDLRPTKDPDPKSFTPNKIMAFIPVNSVVEEKFAI